MECWLCTNKPFKNSDLFAIQIYLISWHELTEIVWPPNKHIYLTKSVFFVLYLTNLTKSSKLWKFMKNRFLCSTWSRTELNDMYDTYNKDTETIKPRWTLYSHVTAFISYIIHWSMWPKVTWIKSDKHLLSPSWGLLRLLVFVFVEYCN